MSLNLFIITEWTEDFKAFAGGEDKLITKEDLERYWQRGNKNPSKEDVNNVCKAVEIADKDGDGKISLKEFLDIQAEAEKAPFFTEDSHAELIEALKCFDTNNNGTVSKEELKSILPDYEDDVLEEAFKSADKNNDGNLSIEELAAHLTATMK